MAKYVRVVAEPTIDNPNAAPLYFDLVIDPDSEIKSAGAIFAFQGDFNDRRGRSLPFVVYSDGMADYGQKYDTPERYGHLNLREGRVVKDRLLQFVGSGWDERFRITRIIPLGEE